MTDKLPHRSNDCKARRTMAPWRAMIDDAIFVLCTVPADGDHAERIARGLCEARLCACVNALPVRSIYRWQGAVEDAREQQLFIKTRRARYAELEAWLRANHPYSQPEILALPIALGSAGYLEWLAAETMPPNQ
jgi:periplasmic divalent cation tolerance protein